MWLQVRKKLVYFTAFLAFAAVLLFGQATVLASPGSSPRPELSPTLHFENSEILDEGEQASGAEQPDSSELTTTAIPKAPEGVGPEESIKTNDFSGMLPFMILFVAIVVVARLIIRRIHRRQE